MDYQISRKKQLNKYSLKAKLKSYKGTKSKNNQLHFEEAFNS